MARPRHTTFSTASGIPPPAPCDHTSPHPPPAPSLLAAVRKSFLSGVRGPQRLPRSACAQQLFLLAMVGLKWSRARA